MFGPGRTVEPFGSKENRIWARWAGKCMLGDHPLAETALIQEDRASVGRLRTTISLMRSCASGARQSTI